MDTDPAETFDFIWFKGSGVTVHSSQRMGGRHAPDDATIYGSDHFSLVSEFEISTLDQAALSSYE
jgi:hypothetical protein